MSESIDVRPADYSDAGNANTFQAYYHGLLAWCDALGWLYFNGKNWEKNEHKAVGKAVELTEEMLSNAGVELSLARHREADAKTAADQKLEGAAEELERAKTQVSKAKAYFDHAKRSRASTRIKGMMDLAKHDMVIQADRLDADPFLLNTPGGEVNLHTGKLIPGGGNHLCATPGLLFHWHHRRKRSGHAVGTDGAVSPCHARTTSWRGSKKHLTHESGARPWRARPTTFLGGIYHAQG